MFYLNENGIGGIAIESGYNAEIGITLEVILWDDGTTSECEAGTYPAFTSHYEAEAWFEGWL